MKNFLKKLFGTCWDCKEIIWPWQSKGMDFQSHSQCHAKRVSAFLMKNPECAEMVQREREEFTRRGF